MEDWRFKGSPHVELGGLRAYAGVPLRFETDYGATIALGSLCVASNLEQPPLTKSQLLSLAHLGDWIVADIIQSARGRRQRERRRMVELLSEAQQRIDGNDEFKEVVRNMLREVYPEVAITIYTSTDGLIRLEGGTEFPTTELEHGLWEDCDYFDYFVDNLNHEAPVASKPIRVIAVRCASQRIPTFLVASSKDFRTVFDDVDSWFVQMAAAMLCRGWQNHALKEALTVKENFLRGITHQLRTPIHGILGSVELLAEELGIGNLQSSTLEEVETSSRDLAIHKNPATYIKTIRSSARELITSVNSLINLNRWTDVAQAERLIAAHCIKDIETELVKELSQATAHLPSTKPSIFIYHQLPSGYRDLTIDLRLFVDCILPLLINAVQNTPGGIVIISISVTEDRASLVVDVKDNGRGISPDDRERIFNAYEKVDSHTTSAGLGLTLACKLASIMNGSVCLVSSDTGKGSHFRASFTEPTLVGSFPPDHDVNHAVKQPRYIFNISSSCDRTSLCQPFSEYVLHLGHSVSVNSDSSIVVMEYSAKISQADPFPLRLHLEKVGLCLVPDSAAVSLFETDEQVRRHENMIYVKGPFSSSVLEEALRQVHSILQEQKLVGSAPVAQLPHSGLTKQNQPTTGIDTSTENITVSSTQNIELSIQTLHIEASTLAAAPLSEIVANPMTLIVDDNAVNLRFLEMYCSRRKIPYYTAMDGLEAFHTFSRHQLSFFSSECSSTPRSPTMQPIRLILMDLQMPICDGISATAKIRALEKEKRWDKATIVIVTGQDSPSDRMGSQQAGADAFFVKPVGPKALDRGIKSWFPDAKI